eukprot:jgi/Chrzof1/5266/Cz15g20020.t1
MNVMNELRKLVDVLWSKISSILQSAPPGALQLTGVLGLAAVLVGYYQLRRNHGRDGENQSTATRRQQQATQPQAARRKLDSAVPQVSSVAASTPLGKAVRSQLVGVKRVTVSAPGVLLQESQATELGEAANLRQEATDILKEVTSCADTYIIAHVVDDIGQAVVSGALESAGLLGNQPRQIKTHKVLFCSTLEGKVSLVRQLEPDLHIDGHARTIEDLQRFMPQLLHITPPGSAASAAQGSLNVTAAHSLRAFFGC